MGVQVQGGPVCLLRFPLQGSAYCHSPSLHRPKASHFQSWYLLSKKGSWVPPGSLEPARLTSPCECSGWRLKPGVKAAEEESGVSETDTECGPELHGRGPLGTQGRVCPGAALQGANPELRLPTRPWCSEPHLSPQDAWSDQKGQIHLDSQQDYQLLRAQRTPEGLSLLFKRPFGTCDPKDYFIEVGGSPCTQEPGLRGALLRPRRDADRRDSRGGCARRRQLCSQPPILPMSRSWLTRSPLISRCGSRPRASQTGV